MRYNALSQSKQKQKACNNTFFSAMTKGSSLARNGATRGVWDKTSNHDRT